MSTESISKMKPPIHNIGDRVIVHLEGETHFEATVMGVWWCLQKHRHEYGVVEDDGCQSDLFLDEDLLSIPLK